MSIIPSRWITIESTSTTAPLRYLRRGITEQATFCITDIKSVLREERVLIVEVSMGKSITAYTFGFSNVSEAMIKHTLISTRLREAERTPVRIREKSCEELKEPSLH